MRSDNQDVTCGKGYGYGVGWGACLRSNPKGSTESKSTQPDPTSPGRFLSPSDPASCAPLSLGQYASRPSKQNKWTGKSRQHT